MPYNKRVREMVLKAAIQFLERSGCSVAYERASFDTALLTVTIPDDSPDPHGDNLRAVLVNVDE